MTTEARSGPRAWRQWTVGLPAALTAAVSILLGTIGWLYAEVAAGGDCALNDGPAAPGCSGGTGWWLVAGGLGQWVLAAAVITLSSRSRYRPGFRMPAAITCWLLLPLTVGWFAFCVKSSYL